MPSDPPTILCLKGGSSSVRFAYFHIAEALKPGISGAVDRLGLPGTHLTIVDPPARATRSWPVIAPDFNPDPGALVDWLEAHPAFSRVAAVGHRVVHGMNHATPTRVPHALQPRDGGNG